ncbi:hypothetical protein [Blastococcus goldschmidtiae]|uniref:Uncharacterized protein n=1 Tax=Blastococcus goldschmidtiae TaxID=3075546 RepID=A0ABU2KCB4_9ACTN|nr:hypothetical protein [Blastococcus sp. DSM 46792]MDT0277823.1 hypothetical protein [Blastococcus sp. DSM 46792]
MARDPDSGRGDAFRNWFQGLPRTTRRVVGAVALIGGLGLWYAFLFAVDSWSGESPGWADPLDGMVGGIVGVGGFLWLQSRRLGGLGKARKFERARRRGRLPDDADPAEWGPLLDQAHRFQRGARSFAVAFTMVTAVAVVAVSAWAGYDWVVVVVIALIGVALVAVLDLASRRQTLRIRRLQEQVQDLQGR